MKKIKLNNLYSFVKVLILLCLASFVLFCFVKIAKNYLPKEPFLPKPGFFGVTYSKKFCEELGLNWKEVYSAIIDDLQVKEIRLPIYWDDIEANKGTFDFKDYDYIIHEGAKRNVKFIINIGWRLPRWPECHAPEWNNKQTIEASRESVLKMLAAVVEHYRNEPNISYWQLENEPFLDAFGVCPPSNEQFFMEELTLVKSMTTIPVMVSATGELSLWRKEAKLGDVFGTTVYRVVWGKWTGYFRYPLPAWFYRLKADLLGLEQSRLFVVELQAEPWVPQGKMIYMSKKEADKSMSFEQFQANLKYATKINFSKTYLWGVEWWYWQNKNGDPRFWDFARTIFK